MERYIGAKIIEAEPMYKLEAVEKGYCRLNDNEKIQDQVNIYGYHVKYADGYESWSPADVFERVYRPVDSLNVSAIDMLSIDYKTRFVAEYRQVKERYDRLKSMCEKWDKEGLGFTPTCPRKLYDIQLRCMSDYISVLEARAELEKIELNIPNN